MEKTFRQLLDNSKNLPTLPAIAIQVLELTRREDAPMAKIVKVISSDPAISAKILRVVNSPFYGLRRQVTSVAQAVSLLGLEVVKNLALGFSLVKNYRGGPGCGFDFEAFWRNSLIGAVAAKQLGSKINSSLGEDVFFVGLLQDIGILALNNCTAKPYAQVQKEASHGVRLEEVEQRLLGFDHMEVGGYLAEKWNLPETFYLPISYHHRPEQLPEASAEINAVTRILCVSADIIDFFSKRRNSAEVLEKIALAGEGYGLFKKDEVDSLMIKIFAESQDLASIFDVDMSQQKSYVEILEEANAELGKIALSFEKVLTDQVMMIEELKEMAYEDHLTGLFNRKSLDATLRSELYRAKRYDRPLALIIGDLDHFKAVNDTHGHQVGDIVLKKICAAIKADLRELDTAFRYGGEEIAVILPETDGPSAMVVAERLRRLVEQLDIVAEDRRIKLTISWGVAGVSSGQTVSQEDLIAAADSALYEAKRSGRNRCCLASLGATGDSHPRSPEHTAPRVIQ